MKGTLVGQELIKKELTKSQKRIRTVSFLFLFVVFDETIKKQRIR